MSTNASKPTSPSQVTASAPGKLMLAGSYAVVHGRSCLATAVDQRLKVTVRKNGKDTFRMEAPELDLVKYSKTIQDLGKKQLPKAVRFIELLYKRFLDLHPQPEGIDVTTASDFSASVGFGSSSAVTVAFAKALTTLYGVKLSNKELFDLCYRAVLDVQGVGSGYDIAMAIWGGTLLYQSPAIRVEPVAISELPLVVGYTGVKADTATLIRMVDEQYDHDPAGVGQIYDQIGEVADQMKLELEAGGMSEAGILLSQHHKLTQKLGVSSAKLDALVFAAEKAGAYGAALSGAGGGDCIVALVDPKSSQTRQAVEQAIVAAGGSVISVSVNAPGVEVH